MKPMKVAVIGSGQIATSRHIPAYTRSKQAEIKYIVDPILERAQAAAEQFGIPIATASLDDVLSDPEVTAVSVCTPNHTHAPVSIAALEAGKHVLCEKPAALSYAEALRMKEAADRTGNILNIGVVNRFNSAVNHVKQLIDAGELGKLYHVYCSFRAHRSIPGLGGPFTTKSMSGGGVLIDWGIHFLDLIFYCLGEDTKALSVSGAVHGELGRQMENYAFTSMWAGPPNYEGTYDVEDFAAGMIRTSGPSLTFNGAWAQNIAESAMYVEFLGDKGGIKLEYGGDFTLYTSRGGMLLETAATFSKVDAFDEEIEAFLSSAAGGVKNRANIDNTLTTAQVIDALYASSEQGKEIVL
ncbi:oxidoreductase [Paenibacillus sp. MY03]|nr:MULTISPECIES: Gfo/Idh/MocA family oxidoreductase [Paenibacillus]OUS75438.1 oxidoreductase [Paenibacillus sp. MY03]